MTGGTTNVFRADGCLTVGAKEVKFCAAVGADGVVFAHGRATFGAEQLFTIRTFVQTLGQNIFALGAGGGRYIWTTPGANFFPLVENKLALGANARATVGAVAPQTVELGATGATGVNVDELLAGDEGVDYAGNFSFFEG